MAAPVQQTGTCMRPRTPAECRVPWPAERRRVCGGDIELDRLSRRHARRKRVQQGIGQACVIHEGRPDLAADPAAPDHAVSREPAIAPDHQGGAPPLRHSLTHEAASVVREEGRVVGEQVGHRVFRPMRAPRHRRLFAARRARRPRGAPKKVSPGPAHRAERGRDTAVPPRLRGRTKAAPAAAADTRARADAQRRCGASSRRRRGTVRRRSRRG